MNQPYIPPPLASMLRQTCVYWAPGLNRWDAFGNPISSGPEERRCRWEDSIQEAVAADGTTFTSRALVYLEFDVQVGGFLMFGDMSVITDPTNPSRNAGAWVVRRFDRLPTIRANRLLRTAYL